MAPNSKRKPPKCFGIFVDESLFLNVIWLTWTNYYWALYCIKQAKLFLKTLYLALIQPYISHDILVWENANSSILKKLCLSRRELSDFVNNVGYNNHTDQLLKNCEIIKLSDKYQYKVCLFVDEFISKKTSSFLQCYVPLQFWYTYWSCDKTI